MNRTRLLLLLIVLFGVFDLSAQQPAGSDKEKAIIKEAVWQAVEKRNSTWVQNDFEGHMSVYHPDFRRWTLHSKTLMTKDIFASFWDGIKKNEKVLNIDIERKEMQILDGGNLAIAHYTIDEDYQWIGEDKTDDDGRIIQKGQKMNGKLRFSDIYIKTGDKWLYLGGHRDGAYLKSELPD